jgi:hypothetical protein
MLISLFLVSFFGIYIEDLMALPAWYRPSMIMMQFASFKKPHDTGLPVLTASQP